MKSLMQVNPKHRKTRDQTMRAATVAVAGPALLVAGYRYPGTFSVRVALMGLAAAMIYSNFSVFRETFEGGGASEPVPEPESIPETADDFLAGLGLLG